MKFYVSFFVSFILASIFSAHTMAKDNYETAENQILIINSSSPLNEHSQKIITSFSHYLNTNENVSISIEHMGCESSPYFSLWSKWMSQLFTAYIQKPNLIVILGDEAWAAYRNSCPIEWKLIPTILGNVQKYAVDFTAFNNPQIYDPMKRILITNTLNNFNVTGYYLFYHELENVHLIKTLQPEINTLLYLDDNPYKFNFSKFVINAATQKCSLSLKYINGQECSTNEVVNIIKQSNLRDALLVKSWLSDATTSPHAETILHNEIRNLGSQIMYSLQEGNMQNEENMGGYYVSCKDIGEDLAKLTSRALIEGIGECPLMSITPSKPQIYLNYNALNRAGINKKHIPSDAIIINSPPSNFDLYKSEFILISLFILCILLAFFVIIISHHKNLASYKNINKQTRKVLYSLPITTLIIDSKYTILDIILPQNCPLFMSYDLNLIVGNSLKNISSIFPDFEETAYVIREIVRHTIISHSPINQEYNIKNYDIQIRSIILENNQIACFFDNLTDIKQAHRILRQNTSFVQSLIKKIPLGIGIRDASDHFKYLFVNDKYKEYYHCDSLVEGKNDHELKNPLADTFHTEDVQLLRSQSTSEHSRTIYNEQKQPCAWLKSSKSIINGSSHENYIVDICTNVTQQRETESVFIRMQQELNIAFETGILFVWSYDVVNQTFGSLNQSSIINKFSTINDILKFINVHDQEKFNDFMNGLLNGSVDNICSCFRFIIEGKEKWLEIHAYSLKNDNNEKINRIIGIGHDISIQMQREKELENNKVRLELAIKASGYFEWNYDTKNQQFSSNDSLSIFHYGIAINDLEKYIHPDDILEFKHKLSEVLNGNINTNHGLFRGKSDSDSYRYYEYIICAFEKDIDSNDIISVIGLHKDVTEQHDKIEKLELMRNKSEEANKMKSAFLANMSHEIRTPVNAIVGFSNLIAESDDIDTRREYYKIIQTNNDLLLQLISDILDLSKIEAGQLTFLYSDFCLNDLFTELQQIYAHNIKNNISFSCNIPITKYIIKSDKKRITQVLSNFMSNANKYTFEGNITLGFEVINNQLKCYVSDTGEGIAEIYHNKVFERFSKFNKTIPGTGLGLSICKNIIEHLNGVIGFESEEGKGSTFWFTFPLNVIVNTVCNENTDHVISYHIPVILLASHSNSMHTLIACIIKKNYSLIFASDGSSALDMYTQNKPDLILMDVLMPNLNGIEVTKEIRKENMEIPIIGLTESLFDENNELMLNAGCTSTISKPIKTSDLLTTLENILKTEHNSQK